MFNSSDMYPTLKKYNFPIFHIPKNVKILIGNIIKMNENDSCVSDIEQQYNKVLEAMIQYLLTASKILHDTGTVPIEAGYTT